MSKIAPLACITKGISIREQHTKKLKLFFMTSSREYQSDFVASPFSYPMCIEIMKMWLYSIWIWRSENYGNSSMRIFSISASVTSISIANRVSPNDWSNSSLHIVTSQLSVQYIYKKSWTRKCRWGDLAFFIVALLFYEIHFLINIHIEFQKKKKKKWME